ncbi:MAG: hypothetical protein J4N97_11725 [Chloroflexi bacterium]|nr:hypothetical protein [Chloroflexota bacterium]
MKWWTGIIAVVCGAELIVAAAIGGAGIGAFFGLDGAFVAALAAATLAFSVRSWLTARRRSRPAGGRKTPVRAVTVRAEGTYRP